MSELVGTKIHVNDSFRIRGKLPRPIKGSSILALTRFGNSDVSQIFFLDNSIGSLESKEDQWCRVDFLQVEITL